jgi:uncharacterized protein (TIGR03435 family)
MKMQFRKALQDISMRKSLLRIAAFATITTSALCAQDISGIWQGTLTVPAAKRDLRLVFKISKTNGAALKAVMYSIDQGAQGLAGTAAVQASTVKITIPGATIAYEGKLDTDGVNLTGTFTQGGGPLPLNLKHVTEQTAWAIPEPAARPKPMAADAIPAFEVATIKPSKPDAQGRGIGIRGRELSTGNTPLSFLIAFSYGVHARQIVGGPGWIDSEKYDILAKPDGEGQPSEKQWKIMIQKMLADRFKLSFHHEKKELSVYAIVLGKNDSKLTKSEGDPNGLPGLGFGRPGVMGANNANMSDFAEVLQTAVLDRPVVDQTGLSGRFDFQLKWTPDETQFAGMGIKVPAPADNPDAPPDLFTAIQEQLGLRLVATRASVDVLVIDRAEKASEN